jgi:hypothetical protein
MDGILYLAEKKENHENSRIKKRDRHVKHRAKGVAKKYNNITMNITDYNIDNYGNAINLWANQSLLLVYTIDQKPLLIFSVVFGFCIMLHSIYKNGLRYKKVQIITELSCIGMIGSGLCYLNCIEDTCDIVKQTVVNNVIGNCFFGLISQLCDNYATFERYNKVVGKTSIIHKRNVLFYIFTFLFLTWFPTYTFLPIFYDLNTDDWLFIGEILNYIYFSCYIFYNNFYLFQLSLEIRKLNSGHFTGIAKNYLLEIIIRSIFHMIFSIIGVGLYVFNLPDGAIEQLICISGSIHIFINYKFKVIYFLENFTFTSIRITSQSNTNTQSAIVIAEN